MSKPIIVCDIDDVVFPFINGIADHYNARFGADLTPEEFISYKLNEVWGGTQEDANGIVEEFLSKGALHLQPLEGVVEALTKLRQDFDIVLVTARNGIFEENTTMWLRTHMPDLFSDVIFAGNPHDGRGFRTKGEICEELGAVLIIDDHPSNIKSAVAKGVTGIFFGNKKWTRDGVTVDPDIKHCSDWQEVLEFIYGEWRIKRIS